MTLLDLFFPKWCVGCKSLGSYICPVCFAKISFLEFMVCAVCQKQSLDGLTHPLCRTPYGIDGVFSSLVYKGVVKKLITRFKYPPYISDLRHILSELFFEGLIQKEQLSRLIYPPLVFVPIPLARAKLNKRGYNQAHLLASQLAVQFGGEVVDCLTRVRDTKTQVGLTKEERAQNILGAFELTHDLRGKIRSAKTIFLVDDVATSGATMREACKVLKKNGAAHVWGLTLAHGE